MGVFEHGIGELPMWAYTKSKTDDLLFVLKKKMNARMKDALDETLILSEK